MEYYLSTGENRLIKKRDDLCISLLKNEDVDKNKKIILVKVIHILIYKNEN